MVQFSQYITKQVIITNKGVLECGKLTITNIICINYLNSHFKI